MKVKKKIQVHPILTYIDDELDEEGLEWDDLEEKAARDDKKHESAYRNDNGNNRPKKKSRRND